MQQRAVGVGHGERERTGGGRRREEEVEEEERRGEESVKGGAHLTSFFRRGGGEDRRARVFFSFGGGDCGWGIHRNLVRRSMAMLYLYRYVVNVKNRSRGDDTLYYGRGIENGIENSFYF